MRIWQCRLRAAFLLPALVAAGAMSCAAPVLAQAGRVDVPAYRQLGGSELMTSPGVNGSDFSANPPPLGGLTLLATIAAPKAPRLGYFIQAQCTAGLTIVFDDEAGSQPATTIVLAGAAAEGAQGGSMSMAGLPHTGRIRIYSTAAECQMAARSW